MTDEERNENEERSESEDEGSEKGGDESSAESQDETSAESESSSGGGDDGGDEGGGGDGGGGDDGDDSGDDSGGDDDGGDGDSGRSVSDVMSGDPVTVEPGDSIEDAAAKMKEADAGAVLVVDGDELKGIATDRDIVVDAVGEGESDARVEDVMTSDPTTVSPDDPIDKAIEVMRDEKVRRLPVVEDGKPVGVVSLGDLAEEADASSVLGEMASAEPNN
jgi:CBS domain-containing protein